MPRYICAEKAEKIMHCMDMQDLYLPIHFKEMILDETPTEDVAPVIHAHWKFLEQYMLANHLECSNCGHVTQDYVFEEHEGTYEYHNPYYCPNCGAKMDEEEKHEKP